jgi:hypothetical protein
MQKSETCLKRYGPMVGLGILIWLVFGQAVHFNFVFWDDYQHIVNNPNLRAPLWQWPKILWIFSFDTSLRFEPGTWLGHMLICTLFSKEAGPYHFCLILLHFINSLLVYRLGCRILSRFATNDLPREAIAFMASAFWALNAVRAETLGRCTDLSYPLSTLFILGSFCFYLVSFADGRLQPYPCLASVILNGLAVCTYPISLGYAFCLPFFDRIFFPAAIRQRWSWRSPGLVAYWSSRILFALPSIAVGCATLHARLHPTGAYAPDTAPVTPFNIFRLVHGIYAWGYIYLHQFWPFGLTPGHYPWPDPGFHSIYWPALFCLAGAIAVAWGRRSAVLWALLASSACLAAPMLGLAEEPTTPVDRYTYLPDAFSALFLAWTASRFWSRHPSAIASRGALGAGMALLPALGWQSHRQLQIWRDSYTLFAHLETSPEIKSQPALQDHISNLKAAQLFIDHDLNAALHIYEDLVRREPENYQYWHNLGVIQHMLGNDEQALKSLRTAYALSRDPSSLQLIQSIPKSHYPPGGAVPSKDGAAPHKALVHAQ